MNVIRALHTIIKFHIIFNLWSENNDPGLEIAADTVANVTNIFPLVTKNSDLVAKVATRFLYDLDLNLKSKVKTNISSYRALLSS